MKKLILCFLLILSLFLVGCGDKVDEPEETETVSDETSEDTSPEPEINDYYGAYTRSLKAAADMKNVITEKLEKCNEVQSLNPSDYWKEKDFASLTLDFMDINSILAHTYALNETQTISIDEEGNEYLDWDAITEWIKASYGELPEDYKNVSVIRNSPNNYTVWNKEYQSGVWGSSQIWRKINAIYDSNHDWSQTAFWDQVKGKDVLDGLLEYGRQESTDGTKRFVLQTTKERAYIVYNEDGTIKNFSYSRLGGDILSRYYEREFEIIAEHNRYLEKTDDFWYLLAIHEYDVKEMTELTPYDDLNGMDYTAYNLNEDSIFTHIDDINEDWVMEMDKDFNLTITYDGKDLTVQFYNVLSQKIEEYIIHEDSSIDKSVKEVIAISTDELMENIEAKWEEEERIKAELEAAQSGSGEETSDSGENTEEENEG